MYINKSISALVFLLLFSLSWESKSQLFQYDQSISVIENGETLSNPFAGGLNGVHLNWIDLNGDGVRELVIFDRSNDLSYAFELVAGEYIWRPHLTDNLPSDIQNWLITADFNNDGLNDIFTHTSFGVRVFLNTSTDESNSWEVAADNLKSLSNGSEVNLVVTSSDYPAVGDFDKDGDIDILVFDFATGNYMTFYKNISIETDGESGLSYDKVDSFWGLIEECNCNDFVFNGAPCEGGTAGRQEHAASKSITIYQDDVYVGIDGCTELAFLPNAGEFASPDFSSFRIDNFSVTEFTSYPIIFFADYDNDGIDDAIIGNNLRNDGYFLDYNQSVRFFKGPGFNLETDAFLQSTMIDVGEQSYPALYDWDNDGDLDLFIGNKGELHDGTYYGTISYYQNTGTFRAPSFELITKDFAELSQFEWIKLIPKFGDFNEDGNTDLLVSAGKSDRLFSHIQYLQGNATGDFASPIEWDFDFSRNDTPTLIDWNSDGVIDLFMGKSFGNIEYYQNNGTNETPDLELTNNQFLGTIPDGVNLFPTIAFYNLDDDSELEIIKSDARGYIEIFQGEEDETGDSLNRFNPDTDELSFFRLGTTNPMVFGDLYGTGETYGIIGNLNGGVHALKLVQDTRPEDESIIAYPNPVQASAGVLKIYSPTTEVVFISDMSGKIILDKTEIQAGQELDINTYSLEPGLYVVKGRNSQFKFYVR